eukprot:TRINITY_DN16272_c0_g1_i1.p1 TRINITY_DN16272_c0_g1~~TRINITY_DN16272_c0_g1_i1.p1  ORF type:complete len:323 (-),score=65.19 TRINITY_DN16272_c0_g1_i1:23-991(-)
MLDTPASLVAAAALLVAYGTLPRAVFWATAVAYFACAWRVCASGMSRRQKVAIATWLPQQDSHTLSSATVDLTHVLPFIHQYRDSTGTHLTITHMLGKAVAVALRRCPGLCGRIVCGRFVPREDVDVCFLVDVNTQNLGYCTVRNTDKQSLNNICATLEGGSHRVRSGNEADFSAFMFLADVLPTFLLRPVLQLAGFLSVELGIECASLHIRRNFMGSCIISNVGQYGVDEAFVPFPPFAGVPLLLIVGAIKKTPVVSESGEIVARDTCTITTTLDHRFVDGHQGALVYKHMLHYLTHPEDLLETEDWDLMRGKDKELPSTT